MLSDKSLESAKKIADACESAGISILTLRDAAYPRRLAGIYDPPAVLYVRGRLPAAPWTNSRPLPSWERAKPRPTGSRWPQGSAIAHGRRGGLVVSGLTAGVDSASPPVARSWPEAAA